MAEFMLLHGLFYIGRDGDTVTQIDHEYFNAANLSELERAELRAYLEYGLRRIREVDDE